jgi:hypothetical protein
MSRKAKKEPWEKHEFTLEDPCCVRCGEHLYLRDETVDWPDDPCLILCNECSVRVIQFLLRKQARMQRKLFNCEYDRNRMRFR